MKLLAEIDALKRSLGAATDSELALLLGLQRSAIAQWKKRGRIPEKAKIKAESLGRHRVADEAAREEFSALSPTVRQISRAIALKFIIVSTEPGDLEADALLFRALFLNEIERAAYILLTEEMKNAGSDARTAYLSVLSDPDFETNLTGRLIPARQASEGRDDNR